MKALSVTGVSKSFKNHFWSKSRSILNDVSLEVDEGEIFGLLGLNGAGKSTLIKIINRILFPDAGTVTIFDSDYMSQRYSDLIGYMPEHPHFYDYLTGREFLEYMGRLFGIPARELRSKAKELLELVGMNTRADYPMRKYSKGMLQRIGLAQALINDPKLVILDEPMSGLDPIGRKEVRDIIFHLKLQGKTIFFSTHILPDVEMICDRVAIIHDGHLQKSGRLSEFMKITTSSVDIAVNIPEEPLRKLTQRHADMKAYRSGEHTMITLRMPEFETEDQFYQRLNTRISELSSEGGTIFSVVPKKQSLEDIFLKEVSGGN